MTRHTPPPHRVLPAAAIALLQRAAQTPITADEPLARVKAIEKATKRVKQQYPEFFKKD
jgi:hypothetical protein